MELVREKFMDVLFCFYRWGVLCVVYIFGLWRVDVKEKGFGMFFFVNDWVNFGWCVFCYF